MNWKVSAMAGVVFLGSALAGHALEPMTFQEISLSVRGGDRPEVILGDVARRKLLHPLSPKELADLSSFGASPSLVEALQAPGLVATPESIAAARRLSRPVGHAVLPAPTAVRRSFSDALMAAKSAPPIALQPGDAFSLSQIEQAKAKAQAEKKPLGFVMVWGSFFGRKAGTRQQGGQSALTHFYQAFKENLVLVFVRHETELGLVPAAVKQGFNGPDEGGFAPNMAVVDATASEFIVEIPLGGGHADGLVRDQIFGQGARKIEQWLASHPLAVAQPGKP